MQRLDYILFHVCTGLVLVTGMVYGWMRYFVRLEDPFAVANHPLQPFFHHAHIVVAPLLVLFCGAFWYLHIRPYWQGGMQEGRKTGLMLALIVLPMIFSGYFLQVSVSETWRTVWIAVHLVSSLGWTLFYGIHVVIHKMKTASHSA